MAVVKSNLPAKAASIRVQSVLEFAEHAYRVYGTLVVQNRALPDFRDGMKPVHRKILWSMYGLNNHSNGGYKKSAKAVAFCMGTYHPHGDQAIYGALVGMVNAPIQLIQGQGNFGGPFDPPAAFRYTEVRLSKFSDSILLDKDYLAVTPMHLNYDGSEKEPLYLPAPVSYTHLTLPTIYSV